MYWCYSSHLSALFPFLFKCESQLLHCCQLQSQYFLFVLFLPHTHTSCLELPKSWSEILLNWTEGNTLCYHKYNKSFPTSIKSNQHGSCFYLTPRLSDQTYWKWGSQSSLVLDLTDFTLESYFDHCLQLSNKRKHKSRSLPPNCCCFT